jgi:hypothetical protein
MVDRAGVEVAGIARSASRRRQVVDRADVEVAGIARSGSKKRKLMEGRGGAPPQRFMSFDTARDTVMFVTSTPSAFSVTGSGG